MAKTTGLGQGVNALFGSDGSDERFFECAVADIAPNKHQPRQHFDESELSELADSIKENGVIQPLVVARSADHDGYELIAGERRLRASKLAGLDAVPVVVQEVSGEDTLLELALIENIQRTDLNPLEEAEAYKKLIDRFGYTQEQTARKVGKKRSTVTNTLRLLLLPAFVKEDILIGVLTEGHGRALLRIIDDEPLLHQVRDEILAKQLSVRQTEQLIRRKRKPQQPAVATNSTPGDDQKIPRSYRKALETQLTNRLNSRVHITENGSRGRIEIEYYSVDDLERLVGAVLNEGVTP